MSGKTMRTFKLFWAWEDEKEELWLRKMSQTGWHLKSVEFPNTYTFERGESLDYVYRLDFNTDRKDYQSYLQLFQDAGWTHIGEYGGWQYFRTGAQGGEDPEIYTDNASKVVKYQRVLLVLVIPLPLLMFMLSRLNDATSPLFEFITFLVFVFILLYIYAMFMLIRRIGQLKRAPG